MVKEITMKLEMIEDLHSDMEDGVLFGNCAESNCFGDACYGVFVACGKQGFNLLLCERCMKELKKEFNKKKNIQVKLDEVK